ncbi:hypothetical protein [Spirosoma endbachense]|uniref:Uncharacterized protein n=1 Tax=Spirosoma endbachense TaxID=2666025 RepID=A0A6P1VPS9_9BACT|nr:hypothetical protein [Spirosoma endbachense]QHV93707.1 hypothetical protein GJR95_01055 [Spirosoma endbachense]
MRYFIPDSIDSTGSSSSEVPSGMDNDPKADEEVIDQSEGDPSAQYPKAVEQTPEPAKIAPDNLADSIAYALDGSGPGPTGEKPNVSEHKPITEGITGAGLDEEEEALRV